MAQSQAIDAQTEDENQNIRPKLEKSSISILSKLADLFFDANEQYRAVASDVGESAAQVCFTSMEDIAELAMLHESKNIHDIAYKVFIWHHLAPEDAKCPNSSTPDEFLAHQIMCEITELATKSGWDHKES